MRWAIIAALLFATPAYSLTFEDGYREGWAEQHGPQFVVVLSEKDIPVLERAFENMQQQRWAQERERDRLEKLGLVEKDAILGIDDYLMGRRARILEKLKSPDFLVLDINGRGWRYQPMSQPEITLTGFAVSRDRYCRAEDQDVDDLGFLEGGVECYLRNQAAIELFGRIEKTRHISPGGATERK